MRAHQIWTAVAAVTVVTVGAALVACSSPERSATQAGSPRPPALAQAGDIASLCDSVAALWRDMHRAEIQIERAADTTVGVVSDSVEKRGCLVQATAPKGLEPAQSDGLYWTTSERRGWAELAAYMADGPDGGSRTLERNGLRCQVDESHDGGDDDDSTRAPNPAMSETTFCWWVGGLVG